MPSLREPLEHVTTCYKAFGESFCALVEAVGVVEEKETLVAAHELTEAKAEWGRLSRKCGEAKVETDQLRKGLAEARADWARLATERHEAKIVTVGLRKELAEAKAEIGRLEKNYDYLHQQVIRTRVTRAELCRQLTEARVELESYTASVNADAEIGRLVRDIVLDKAG